METVYFDNSATSFPKPEIVYETMDYVARNYGVNAGRGSYCLAHKAGELIEETRLLLAKLVNFNNYNRIILTPSATIALNIILKSISWEPGDNIFFTPFEHNSILRPLQDIKEKNRVNLYEIPVNKKNFVFDLNLLEEKFQYLRPRLLIANHGSNVCGVIAPIKQLTELTHKYGGEILIDGAQTLGLMPVDISSINCDYFVFAGHKNLYGPIGVGGVFVNADILVKPLVYGGTGSRSESLIMPDEYPDRLEAGSPAIVAIAGLNAGIKWVEKNQNVVWSQKQGVFKAFLELIKQFHQIKIWGNISSSNQLPIAALTVEGYTPQEFSMILDQNYNIGVRSGLHCAPLAHKFLGTFPSGAVRFSFGLFNSTEEIELLGSILSELFG